MVQQQRSKLACVAIVASLLAGCGTASEATVRRHRQLADELAQTQRRLRDNYVLLNMPIGDTGVGEVIGKHVDLDCLQASGWFAEGCLQTSACRAYYDPTEPSDVDAHLKVRLRVKVAEGTRAWDVVQFDSNGVVEGRLRDAQGWHACCTRSPGRCGDRTVVAVYHGAFDQGAGVSEDAWRVIEERGMTGTGWYVLRLETSPGGRPYAGP